MRIIIANPVSAKLMWLKTWSIVVTRFKQPLKFKERLSCGLPIIFFWNRIPFTPMAYYKANYVLIFLQWIVRWPKNSHKNAYYTKTRIGDWYICTHANKRVTILAIAYYSALSNKRTVWNNRAGYYIGLFGYFIKNYFLFNKSFWKNPKNNNRACTFIRERRV